MFSRVILNKNNEQNCIPNYLNSLFSIYFEKVRDLYNKQEVLI